jgi:hypothetical protein
MFSCVSTRLVTRVVDTQKETYLIIVFRDKRYSSQISDVWTLLQAAEYIKRVNIEYCDNWSSNWKSQV